MIILSTKKLSKDYQLGKTTIHALRGIDMEIHKGDFITILGPSGCGKTTLLNLFGSIDDPSSGQVVFDGHSYAELSDNQKADLRLHSIGFIFQSFNLIPVLDVRENIEFPMILANIPKSARSKRVAELVDMVGLQDFADHKPDELSGGQRQRVAIARALVNNPKLVIADEPTANLDSETGASIINQMRKLNEEQQVTFLFSTHNPEIMSFAKRIIKLKDGRIQS